MKEKKMCESCHYFMSNEEVGLSDYYFMQSENKRW